MFRAIFPLCCVFVWLLINSGVQQGCSPPIIQPDAAEPIPDSSPTLRCFTRTVDTPVIKQFDYDGQTPNQPRKLLFVIKWADTPGSLFGGHYQFTLEGSPAPRFPLPKNESFKKDREGTIQLSLALPKQAYPPKQQLSIELKIWDVDGNASNHPLLVLEVNR